MDNNQRFNYINKTGKEPPEAGRPIPKDGWALYYCGKALFGPARYDFCVAERNKLLKHGPIKKESLKIKPYKK